MPIVRSTVSHDLARWMEAEAKASAGTVSDLIRSHFQALYRVHTTVVEKENGKPAAKPKGRPITKVPLTPYQLEPGDDDNKLPSTTHMVMWERAGVEVWESTTFTEWLDREYPFNPKTRRRSYPDGVTIAEQDDFCSRTGW